MLTGFTETYVTPKRTEVLVYQRVNCTWVDIPYTLNPLPNEISRVLGTVPGARKCVRVTGPNVPQGYRRYEVTT